MRRARVATLATLVMMLLGVGLRAQPGESLPRESQASAATGGSLRFRRVYAPAERVQDWPRGTARYVPVDGEEFERLLKAAQEQAGNHPAAAALARAEYTAQFDGIDRLQGTLAWEIERTGSSDSSISLAPLNLALEKTRWSDSPQPLALGMGENGAVTLIANRAGTVTGTWSLRGRHDNDGQLAFRFEVPPATFSTLLLTVPPGVVPTVGSGLASFVEEQTERHVYRLLLGGASQVTLRLPRDSTVATNQPKVLLRETAVYNLSPRGLDLAAVWKLDVHATPLRQLEIEIDPGLQLVAARLGDNDIPFTAIANDGQVPNRVILDLPEALAGSDRPLRLSAIGPLPTGPGQLPRIRAANCTWQEGTCTLLVQEPLVTRRLTTRDCRQTKYSLLPEPNRGESFEIQWFSESSAVECDLARDAARANVSTGLRLELGDDLAAAQLVALAHGARGRCTSLVADVGPEWLIDSVATEPRDAIDRWHVETDAAVTQLKIWLARPLATDTPVKLIVRAHRAASKEDRQWLSSELDVLRFFNVEIDQQWLTLAPASGQALTVSNVENLPIASDASAADWATLFLEAPENSVYRCDPVDSRFTARIAAKRPAYLAKIVATATVDATSVNESCSLRCQPFDAPVSNILVRFSESRSEPPRFQLQGELQAALTARRVTNDDDAVQAAGESWEVTLLPPQASAFEINIERTTPFTDRIALGLVQLPDAASQQAQFVVDAAADVEISIESSGLTSLPVADDPVMPTTRGVYAYTPGQITDRSSTEKIVVVRHQSSTTPATAATVWHRRTESQYDVAGNSWHSATFQLRNAGQRAVMLAVPDGCEITRLWLDGRLLQRPTDGQRARLELPADETRVMVAVEYRGPSVGLMESIPLTAPVATIDVPIFSSDWLLWVPPGFALDYVDGGTAEPAPLGLSWSERLFGPLGRGNPTPPFAPWSWSSWRNISAHADGDTTASALVERFEVLAQSRAQFADPIEWGSLLSAAAELAEESGMTLRVDAAALAAAGIGPRSRVVPVPQDFAGQPVPGLLERSHLLFLKSPRGVLLTSGVVASLKRDQLRRRDRETMGMLQPGPLQTSVESRSVDDEQYPTAAIWARQGQQPDAPPEARFFAGDLGAATPFLIHCDGQNPPLAGLVYVASRNATRAAACLLALAICLCFARRVTMLIVGLGIAAAAALVLPDRLAPLATGVFWGISLAIAWQWLAPRLRIPVREIHSSSSKSTARRLATAAPLLLAILSLAGMGLLTTRAAGQHDNKAAPRDEGGGDVYRVFIPVDDQEQPTTDKYQVPERLYDELQHVAARGSGASTGWLIRSARYQLSLASDGVNEGYVATDVRTQYDVLVLASDVVLRLPMLGVRPGLIASREGREIELEWDIDEDGFYCHFDEPGMYQLNLSLRTQRGEGTAGSLDIAIPPVPHSTAIVQMPASLSSVEVPSALGSSSLSDDRRTLTAELGATDRLTVQWARSRQRHENIAGEAETWLWLQVQPASVIVHARIDISELQAPLNELWLSVDPRLRALPVVDRTGTVVSVQPLADDPRTVRVELARPITDHATVPVSFLLVGSSGIGQLALPRIEPQGVHVGKRVLAVSVEPALEFSVPEADPKFVMNVGEFLTHWGGAPAPPQSVVQLGADEPWTLSTRPRNPTVPARQALTLSIGPRRALVRFVADIAGGDIPVPVSTYILQHRVRAPVDLEIEKLSLVQDGMDRVSRWTRDESGLVSVFLASPVTGRQQLTIEGWLPTPLEGNWPLPRIDLDSVAVREAAIFVSRQPSVQVVVRDLQGLVEATRPRSEESPLPGQPVASLVANQMDYRGTVLISPNHPQVRATLLTTINRDNTGPQGTLDFHAVVEDGFMDTISIDLPAAWTGPFDISPAAAVEIVSTPQFARRLLIRPKTPAVGDVQFSLRGPLELVNDRPLAMPTLTGDVEGETFAMLPAGWGAERMHWKTRGMQPDRLPDGMARATPLGDAQVFRVIETDAAVFPTIAPAAVTAAQPTGKIEWFYDASGASHGIATYLVHDAAERTCRLRLPDGVKVLELRVAGRLLTPAFINNSCTLKLAAAQERQAIEIVFTGKPLRAAQGSSAELAAPFLEGIDFAETTWLVDNAAQGSATALETADMPRPTAVHRDVPGTMDARAIGAGSMATRFDFAGNVPKIRIQFGAPARSTVMGRWIAAALLVVTGVIFGRLPSARVAKPTAPVLIIAGVTMGMMASTWLTPGWIGIPIALLGVAAGYRQALGKWLRQSTETAAGEPSA